MNTIRKVKRLVILGAGGHGQAVAEAAHMMGAWDSIAFLDDGLSPPAEVCPGMPVLGTVADAPHLMSDQDECLVAIGNQQLRRELTEKLLTDGMRFATVIHPRAWVSAAAVLEEGVTVMAGAVVGGRAQVGRGVIINANATVDHDAILEDFVHLGVGVQLAGGVIVRAGAWLQSGVSAGYRVVVPAQAVIEPGTALKGA